MDISNNLQGQGILNMKMLKPIVLILLASSTYVKSQSTDYEKLLRGHSATVLCLDNDELGRFIYSGSYDTDLIQWDFESGNPISKYSNHSSAIRKIKISPDNIYIACGAVDSDINARGSTINCVSLLDAESLELLSSLSIEPDRYLSLGFIPELDDSIANGLRKISFNPGCTKLAAITKRGDLFIWDMLNEYKRSEYWFGNTKHKLLNISPDWNYLVCTERKRQMADSCFYFMTLEENDIIASFDSPCQTVSGVYFSNDRETIVSVGGNRIRRNEIYVWDISSTSLKHKLIGHGNVIRSIDFSNNDQYIASAGEDNLINLWDLETGRLIASFTEGNEKELTSVVFSHDDSHLITGSQDMTIKYWNINHLIKTYKK